MTVIPRVPHIRERSELMWVVEGKENVIPSEAAGPSRGTPRLLAVTMPPKGISISAAYFLLLTSDLILDFAGEKRVGNAGPKRLSSRGCPTFASAAS
jgi:hypothetical protein